MRNRNLFNKVISDLSNKRRNILKDVFDNLFNYGRDILNNKVFKIPDNLRKRILNKWLKIWEEKTKKLSKLRSTEMIQKNYRLYKSFIRNKGIKNHLNKHDDLLKKSLRRWRNIIKNMKVKRSGKRIANFIINKFRLFKAKENWKKLSNALNHKDQTSKKIKLIYEVKKYMILRNYLNYLERQLKLNGWNKLKNMLHYRNKLRSTGNALRHSNKKNNLFKLLNYINKWLDQINK